MMPEINNYEDDDGTGIGAHAGDDDDGNGYGAVIGGGGFHNDGYGNGPIQNDTWEGA